MTTRYDITYAPGGYQPGVANAAGVPADYPASNIESVTVTPYTAEELVALNSVTTLAFMQRFTTNERVALQMARIDPNTPLQTRAALEAIQHLTAIAATVNVTDPDTQMGASVAADVLVAAGLVTSANRDARIAQLLAPASA